MLLAHKNPGAWGRALANCAITSTAASTESGRSRSGQVGIPARRPVVAAYLGLATIAWLAAASAGLAAAGDLGRGSPLAPDVLLATHLVGLGFLPVAVTGAALHILPILLRTGLPPGRLHLVALPLLAAGGPLVAHELAYGGAGALFRAGTGLLSAGLLLVLVQVGWLVVRAPRGRALLASRAGVALSAMHAALALAAGAALFGNPDLLGIAFPRALLVHLHLAVLGWLVLLIVTVGRTLGPMLALAPAEPPRRLPLDELALAAGLWLLLGGLAADVVPLALAGAAIAAVVLARFVALLARVGREFHTKGVEGPLVHFLAGALFLVQAVMLGVLALVDVVDPWRAGPAYVVLLLVGFAAGVTLGHLGKLLALSAWHWWPPGPRPKQAWFYPRRLWLAEAAVFATGVEGLALGALARSSTLATAGAAAVLVSAALACAAVLFTLRRGPR